MHSPGQGATEYLVLLAVVLIVALVSVALLGFFPGMASDAQMTQSKIYWQSASPVSVLEVVSKVYAPRTNINLPYIRLRNTGAYPIQITKVIGGTGRETSTLCGVGGNIADHFYLAPGEEAEFGYASYYGGGASGNHGLDVYLDAGGSGTCALRAAISICENSTTSPGTLNIPNFGFEYITYIEGSQITKREVGTKPLIVKCLPP